MSTVQGHTIKYKTESDEWVSIPVLTGDVYTAYRDYCVTKNIPYVDIDTYYQTLGSLQDLVKQFADSSEAVAAMSQALSAGALPQHMGGLGVIIGPDGKYKTLREALVDVSDDGLGVGVALKEHLDLKSNSADFAYGSEAPNERTDIESAQFYFQFKE